ncbi:glycosyltransferase [Streptacidiphilus sp. PB12-B1b]|uniref:bifunctional glycosyltransferase/CDP-glycerol:glycerophosphate glycerophosphotransferase n=1 Tax=Streptacidiphilus sp. PB12-B1b TaxID=2705012 RepID=UPI0015FDBC4B|nr:bifunctional glycosyltransferase/CDP-glycerol:glycerophosphate glycerophosphotransferase [Streptacidiphilus sp. PB12-B1b]QMU79236.1 glycosyltransferase [Streptacidiphilus sp. PB12-B1b]
MESRLSVVVPVHNVEAYLQECLESIRGQSFGEFDVVLIDDGSTDRSAEIAESFAARDPRFRLFRQPNEGLGAARNAGLLRISPGSEYLAFVDSDDTLPPDAYRLLVDTLDGTGSDFAAGNVMRFRSVGSVASPIHRKPFADTLLRTHITRTPALVTDRTVWNKVYRRSFWDRHTFRYPEGILYEDAPVTIPAHFAAERVDVLRTPVYNWREREAGAPSITQRRNDTRGMRDRITSIDLVRAFLGRQRSAQAAQHLRLYDENVANEELHLFIKVLRRADEEFRSAYMEAVGGLLGRIDPAALRACPEPARLKLHLTAAGRLDDLLELLAYEEEYGAAIPLRGGPLGHRADYPFLRDRPPVPAAVLKVGPELAVETRLDATAWRDGVLQLSGRAWTAHLGAERRATSAKALVLREVGGRRALLLPTRTVSGPQATAESGQSLLSYDWAGFVGRLDPLRLRHRGQWREGSWRASVLLPGGGRLRRSRIRTAGAGSARHPSPQWVERDVRIVPQIRDSHLYVEVERVRARITGAAALAGGIELTGTVCAETAAANGISDGDGVRAWLRLRRSDAPDSAPVDLPLHLGQPVGGASPFRVRLTPQALGDPAAPAALPRDDRFWDSQLLLRGGRLLPLVLDERESPDSLQQLSSGPEGAPPRVLHVKRSPRGYLQVCEQLPRPLVEYLAPLPDGSGFTLAGRLPLTGRHQLQLRLARDWSGEVHHHPVEAVDGHFTARLHGAADHSYAGDVPLQPGSWTLAVTGWPGCPAPEPLPLQLASRAHHLVPAATTVKGARMTLDRVGYDQLSLTVHHTLDAGTANGYRQRLLRTVDYPAARRLPLRDAVLYDDFGGKRFGDSPRAVHAELVRRGAPLEHLWTVCDGQVDLPATATALPVRSPEWYEALARCRYIVGNTHLPPWIERREGQVVVQTWHGTPLKRIGHDFENTLFSSTGYLDDLDRESRQWSLLLSPNRFSTPILRRALRFDGEILESGYPRNDALCSPDREKTAERVRRALRLPEHKRVVLYAPTWRETLGRHRGGFAMDLRIDLEHARRELAGDHVLLVRTHTHVVEAVPGADGGFVRDVSAYPDVTDLLLAADVLVTDYSSLMFDFAVTGKPMLFFTYDLEEYRDALRGFYLDFERRAPGPLLRTSEQLVRALRGLDRATAAHAGAYRAFRADFCELDDGGAAARVADRMLELGAARR